MFEIFLGSSDVIKECSELITRMSVNVEMCENWLRKNLDSKYFSYVEQQVRDYKSEITYIQYFIKHLLDCGYKPVTGGNVDGESYNHVQMP